MASEPLRAESPRLQLRLTDPFGGNGIIAMVIGRRRGDEALIDTVADELSCSAPSGRRGHTRTRRGDGAAAWREEAHRRMQLTARSGLAGIVSRN
jgi:hypothetical protein